MKTREFFPCAGHDWCVRGEKTAVGVLALVKPLVHIGLGGIGLFPAGVFMMKWANRRVFTMKCISGNSVFIGFEGWVISIPAEAQVLVFLTGSKVGLGTPWRRIRDLPETRH